MSHYHPSEEMLRSFCLGQLDDVLGAMVAAHVNLCEESREICRRLDEELAVSELEFAGGDLTLDDDLLTQMLANVDAAPEVEPSIAVSAVQESTQVKIQGRKIQVPAVLEALVERSGPWNHVINELWQSPVTGHGLGYQVDFIYMNAGGGVPQHTHRGREITLVLDGSFEDDEGEYNPGDFLIRTSEHRHQPISRSGCLCLAAIDSPLQFTSGLSRLLNPFSHLFFRSEA